MSTSAPSAPREHLLEGIEGKPVFMYLLDELESSVYQNDSLTQAISNKVNMIRNTVGFYDPIAPDSQLAKKEPSCIVESFFEAISRLKTTNERLASLEHELKIIVG
jgi:hypothetical protein